MSCCICFKKPRKWYHAKCNHTWCRKCHREMQRHYITECPLCRQAWFSKITPMCAPCEPHEAKLFWKRHRKRELRAYYQQCFF